MWSIAAIMALGLSLSVRTAHAQDMDVPMSVQIPLFLKVLSFDRHLEAVGGTELVIAVVYQGGFRASVTAKDEAVRGLRELHAALPGRTIRVVLVDLDQVKVDDMFTDPRFTVLYLTPVRAVDIGGVSSAAAAAGVTTFTGVPRYVAIGIAVGVRLQGDRPKLMINVEAARRQGANFSSQLLKLAQVVP